MKRYPLIPALFLLAGAVVAAQSPFEGTWSMISRMGGNEIPATMTLSISADGIEGLWVSQGREMTLTAFSIEGDSIEFDREVQPGTVLHFSGTLDADSIEGAWSGSFGNIPCSGTRGAGIEVEEDDVPGRHDRPIVEEDGRRKLWAGESEDGVVDWFDMTDSTIDPYRFQFGIGKDTIPSIDAPNFVAPDDPLLAVRGVTLETAVLGVAIDGISRAYPVAVMDLHEVVNDRFGDKAFAVLW